MRQAVRDPLKNVSIVDLQPVGRLKADGLENCGLVSGIGQLAGGGNHNHGSVAEDAGRPIENPPRASPEDKAAGSLRVAMVGRQAAEIAWTQNI